MQFGLIEEMQTILLALAHKEVESTFENAGGSFARYAFDSYSCIDVQQYMGATTIDMIATPLAQHGRGRNPEYSKPEVVFHVTKRNFLPSIVAGGSLNQGTS